MELPAQDPLLLLTLWARAFSSARVTTGVGRCIVLFGQHTPTDRYEMLGELARGGMGVVARVRDRATGRTVALKRSLSLDGPATLRRSMLEREYQTLVTLRNPYIIDVYDFGVADSGPYYTMELLDGEDLRAK